MLSESARTTTVHAMALVNPDRVSDDTGAIDLLNWSVIANQLDVDGYALLPGLLGPDTARELARQAGGMTSRYLPLATKDMGCAELFYVDQAPWAAWRAAFYRRLAVVANRWNDVLGIDRRYPAQLHDFIQLNCNAGQRQEQSYVCRLGVEGHLALHQRADGEHVFPFQMVALLSEPEKDFEGGEFVMVEQRPRMQSRPIVLPLRLGDAAIISTAVRPFKGSSGYYRVNLKHAISRVHRGERIGMEWSFHQAR